MDGSGDASEIVKKVWRTEANKATLDSVGCIVFARRIKWILDDEEQNCPDIIANWGGYAGVLAIIASHEIGHAMGITEHHSDDYASVMSEIDEELLREYNQGYIYHNHFEGPELNHSAYSGNEFLERKSSVNLRDLLGVTTIDIGS